MRITKVLAGISITLLIFLSVVMLVCNWSATGLKTLDVPTGSMVPAIPQNSLVLVKSVPAQSLKVGDVITYKNPQNIQTTISHRIIKTYLLDGRVPAFITKGDANNVPDVPVTSGSVVGKVLWHVPHAGAWLQWSKGWIGLAAMVYLPAFLLMAEEVKRLGDYLGRFKIYRLRPLPRAEPNWPARRAGMAGAGGLAVILLGLSFAPTALALLQSNMVSLTNNRLSVAATTPPTTCTGTHTNNTNVTVTNTSNQTATSGSASNTNNTTGGNATTGNATNNNSSNTSITVTNGC